jgi:hypothetical protein
VSALFLLRHDFKSSLSQNSYVKEQWAILRAA